jgi:hypothetical protein
MRASRDSIGAVVCLWEARRALWAEGEGRFTEVDPKRKAGEGDIGRRLSLGGHLIAGCIAGLSV